MSIRAKLTLVFLIFISIATVAVGVLTYANARSSLKALRISQLENIADLKKDKIEAYFNERIDDLKTFQDYSFLKKDLSVITGRASDPKSPAYQAAMKELDIRLRYVAKVYGYADIMLTDTTGKVVYASNEVHRAEHLGNRLPDPSGKTFEYGKRDIYLGNIYKSKADGFSLMEAAPLVDGGRFLGVIAIALDMGPMYKFIQDATGLGNTGEALLVRKHGGKVLFLNPTRHDPDAALNRTITFGSRTSVPTQLASSGKNGSGIALDYRGRKVISAWRYMPTLGWGLVTKIDASEAFASVTTQGELTAVIMILSLFAGGVAAFYMAKSITDPVMALQKGAEIIVFGNLDYKVAVSKKDEFGALARTFESMAQNLKTVTASRDELDKEIAERMKAKGAVREHARQQAALAWLGQQAVTAADIGTLFDDTVATVAATLDVEYCKVLELMPDGNSLLLRAGVGWKEGLVGTATVGAGNDSQAGFTLMADGPVVVEDLGTETRFSGPPLLHEHGVVSGISTIIRGQGRHFGVIGAHTKARRVFSEDDVNFLQSVANVLAETIVRERAYREVRLANLYNRSLLEASLDPLVTIGQDGNITDVNAATELATGLTRGELVGTDFSDYFTVPDKAFEGYKQVFREGFVRDYPLEVRHKDGHTTPALYNASLYQDEAGNVTGVFAAARDVTELKKAEEEVRNLNAELEQRVVERTAELVAANKELEAFSYSVSHDLRAPLRHIQGFSELLLKNTASGLDEKCNRYLSTIAKAASQLGTLIDDLLVFSRMGRAEMNKVAVNIEALVEDTRRELDDITTGREIEWKVENLPEVKADPALLKLVFTNLISNAVKFTRPRSPARIEIGCTDCGPGEVEFYVKDNGVGFDMQYVDKLFGVFQRLHRADEFEGTGIGLANVRRIIHRHGGRTWAEGKEGEGAVFHFTLPKS